MALSAIWNRGLWAAFLLGALALIVLLVRPVFLDEEALRARLAVRLAAWTGGTVEIAGQTQLSYFPEISIQAQGVRIRSIDRIPALESIDIKMLRADLGFWSLLTSDRGVEHLVVSEPTVRMRTLAEEQRQDGVQSEVPLLVRAMESAPAERISVAQGALTIVREGSREWISELDAEFFISDDGASSGSGSFSWRGQPVKYGFTGGTPKLVANTAKAPMTFSIESPLIRANATGEATLGEAVQMQGTLDVQADNLRKMANWMGVPIPDGAGLGSFSASGAVNWSGPQISYENGTFALDGNKAQGALALKFGGVRPAIDGTLALQQINLSQYFAKGATAADKSKDARDGRKLHFPALRYVDLDLRLSTARIDVAGLALGESALTISLVSNVLAADVSALDLCAGRGNARLTFDATGDVPLIKLAGTLTGVSAAPCIKAFVGLSPIEGTADLNFDLAGAGQTTEDVLKGLNGTLTTSMGAGQTAVDLANAVKLAKEKDLQGWKSVIGNSTRFESLLARFALHNGNARADDFKIRTSKLSIVGEGSIDLASRRLDWRLVLGNAATADRPRLRALVARLADSLVIYGPWSDPTIRLERRKASLLDGDRSRRTAVAER